jgi:hypothetical protein
MIRHLKTTPALKADAVPALFDSDSDLSGNPWLKICSTFRIIRVIGGRSILTYFAFFVLFVAKISPAFFCD